MNYEPKNFKRIITSHLISHWGVPANIQIRSSLTLELAVLEFAPGRHGQAYRFATNGMSQYAEMMDGQNIRTELYVCAQGNEPWIIDFLVILAQYPSQNQTSFCEFDTVPLESPINKKSPFTALLIAPLMPLEPHTLCAIEGNLTEQIFVHQVVGIFQEEYLFAMKHSSEELWRLLLLLQEPLLIDQNRTNAINQLYDNSNEIY